MDLTRRSTLLGIATATGVMPMTTLALQQNPLNQIAVTGVSAFPVVAFDDNDNAESRYRDMVSRRLDAWQAVSVAKEALVASIHAARGRYPQRPLAPVVREMEDVWQLEGRDGLGQEVRESVPRPYSERFPPSTLPWNLKELQARWKVQHHVACCAIDDEMGVPACEARYAEAFERACAFDDEILAAPASEPLGLMVKLWIGCGARVMEVDPSDGGLDAESHAISAVMRDLVELSGWRPQPL